MASITFVTGNEDRLRDARFVLGIPNDFSWSIPALNGFPSGYMKDVAQWQSSEDFLAFMRLKKDKRTILTDTVVYIDGANTKLFETTRHGVFTSQPKGKSSPSFARVVKMGDDEVAGTLIAINQPVNL